MLIVLKYLGLAVVLIAVAIVAARAVFAIPPNRALATTALPAAQTGPLADALRERTARHEGKTGIAPLRTGADAFAARMVLADVAVKSIDAQYYIWHDDLTGMLLLDALKRAADRGVRVRLLLDDNGTSGMDRQIVALDAHPMAEVRIYNPFNLRGTLKMASFAFDFFRLNRRMHNKSFTVDGHVTVTGGRNVGDEYFDTGPTALYVDLDVLAAGRVVPQVSADFDRYWNSPSVHPASQVVPPADTTDAIGARLAELRDDPQMAEYRGLLGASHIVEELVQGDLGMEWTDVRLFSDDPAKGQGAVPREDLLAVRLKGAVGEIEQRFDAVSAYFVPTKAGVDAFTRLEQRGARVRILTNSLEATDVLPVHAGYSKRREAMLDAGVELYELRRQAASITPRDKVGPFGSSGSSLHAKTFAVDAERIFVGSFNFDPRSTTLNTEMGLLIESPDLARGAHERFDRGLDGMAWRVERLDGKLIWTDPSDPGAAPLTSEPGGSPLRNAAITVIGWLPVEWLL
ncbi:phospholipase D/Transphosphatidylase [Oceaniovalibus guishaninsula JLT2003]|uniref:Phospholipase D n=1 Tax=Oceaniovalibus guishaninsula JLT2003 TaxID=1231392 RepID=K2HFJ2_9RHOB|nr:phospholipase D family protein [Oceaniovalibus guishaninsula]EKE45252.1 phospholipase D/Transphosphatidylase [Oceaniovalibus guishaninsula JLT2003]